MSGTPNRTGQRSESPGSTWLPAVRVLASGASAEDFVMAKTGKKTVEKQPSEAPTAKTGLTEVTDAEKKMSDYLAEIQVLLSLKLLLIFPRSISRRWSRLQPRVIENLLLRMGRSVSSPRCASLCTMPP